MTAWHMVKSKFEGYGFELPRTTDLTLSRLFSSGKAPAAHLQPVLGAEVALLRRGLLPSRRQRDVRNTQ